MFLITITYNNLHTRVRQLSSVNSVYFIPLLSPLWDAATVFPPDLPAENPLLTAARCLQTIVPKLYSAYNTYCMPVYLALIYILKMHLRVCPHGLII